MRSETRLCSHDFTRFHRGVKVGTSCQEIGDANVSVHYEPLNSN